MHYGKKCGAAVYWDNIVYVASGERLRLRLEHVMDRLVGTKWVQRNVLPGVKIFDIDCRATGGSVPANQSEYAVPSVPTKITEFALQGFLYGKVHPNQPPLNWKYHWRIYTVNADNRLMWFEDFSCNCDNESVHLGHSWAEHFQWLTAVRWDQPESGGEFGANSTESIPAFRS